MVEEILAIILISIVLFYIFIHFIGWVLMKTFTLPEKPMRRFEEPIVKSKPIKQVQKPIEPRNIIEELDLPDFDDLFN
jgi:uncharacterized membrane protein YvbJ